MLNRMLRAAQLEAVSMEHDSSLLVQALWVIAISSATAGTSATITGGLLGLAQMGLTALLSWFLWSLITHLLLTILIHTTIQIGYRQTLSAIGFSASPGMIRILGIIPFLSGFIHLVAQVWMFLAMVTAVRHTFDHITIWQTVGVVLPGWSLQAVMVLVVFLLLA